MFISVVAWNPQKVLAQQNPELLTISSFSELENAYGSRINQARWNANADLNKDGRISLADLVIFAEFVPLVLSTPPNMLCVGPIDGATFNINTKDAEQCVLSYSYTDSVNTTEWQWTNQTMTKNGNGFTTTICFSSLSGVLSGPEIYSEIYYKIYAINGRYITISQTPDSMFPISNDP